MRLSYLGKRKRPGEGASCERLTERLEEYGVRIDTLVLSLGYWSHAHQDCERWCAHGVALFGNSINLLPDTPVSFHSWDTVTACARRGIDPVSDSIYGRFNVYAREALHAPRR